jgi:hypothetical protein
MSPVIPDSAKKRRIVSFSLYGTNPLYLEGAMRNVQLLPNVYPNWVARIYVSQEVSPEFCHRLTDAGAEVVQKRRIGLVDGTFWRFLPASESDVEFVVVRDVDSRVTDREFAAVTEWMESGKTIHIMRDHPSHHTAMLAGMWGCRGGCIPDMQMLIDKWGLCSKKGLDQAFLRDVIYPRFLQDCMVHSDFCEYAGESARPFPTKRYGGEFVGCVYDSDRNTLTAEQHTENLSHFAAATLRKFPRARTKHKLPMLLKHWFRRMRRAA